MALSSVNDYSAKPQNSESVSCILFCYIANLREQMFNTGGGGS